MTAAATPSGDPVARTGRPLGDRVTTTVEVPGSYSMAALLGPRDAHLRRIERAVPEADVHVRGNVVSVSGPAIAVAWVERALAELLVVLEGGEELTEDTVARIAALVRDDLTTDGAAQRATTHIVSGRGRAIRAKTAGQQAYVDAIDSHTVVFGIGPAGTGKTYLAVAKAVQALQARAVNRIILTRPAVEAGERLGFLPGTLNEKIDPYLRPLYDALHDMLDPATIPRLLAEGTIEVAPLAYMRGRTLSDSFIILDEAQNTSAEQMKMFLTRLGFRSTMVVTGDTTQVDLPAGTRSGLRMVESVLAGIEDISFCHLGSQDVVRHRLVGEIVEAYARADAGETRS